MRPGAIGPGSGSGSGGRRKRGPEENYPGS